MRYKQLCSTIKYLSNQEKEALLTVACMLVTLHHLNTQKLQNWWEEMRGSGYCEQCADPSFMGHWFLSFYCFVGFEC